MFKFVAGAVFGTVASASLVANVFLYWALKDQLAEKDQLNKKLTLSNKLLFMASEELDDDTLREMTDVVDQTILREDFDKIINGK